MFELPAGLPEPIDDGACDHLENFRVPSVALPSTQGGLIDLGDRPGRSVVFCYPLTGKPGDALPSHWDEIPGARGCTPQACSFRDRYQRFNDLGFDLFGLSVQPSDYQQEAADRLHLPYPLLSDYDFVLTNALSLPTLMADDRRYLKRVTLMINAGVIEKCFYPVFPPDQSAQVVLEAISRNRV